MRRGGGSPRRSPTRGGTPCSRSGSGADRAAHDQAGPATRGTHEVCESPRASDDTRLDLSSHRRAVRLSSEGSDSRSIGAVQLRPQLNSGSRFRTERTVSGLMPGTAVADRLWGRVASPDLLRGRTDRRPVRLDPGDAPPPPGSSELPNHAGTDSGRGDSARTAATVLVVHVHDDVAT